MMKPQAKKLWVDALRSGDYEQGRGYLCQDDKWCCLGVLIDVTEDGWWEPRAHDVGHRYAERGTVWTYNGHTAWLPTAVADKMGLTSLGMPLGKMNDEGVSFAQIADWIEEHL